MHCINVWESFLSLHGCWNSAWDYFHKHLKNKTPFKKRRKNKSMMAQRLKKQRSREKNFPSDLLSPSQACLSSLIPSFFMHTSHTFYYLLIYLFCEQRSREQSETEETLSWEIPGNNTAEPSFSRKACLALEKPGVHNSLTDNFYLFFSWASQAWSTLYSWLWSWGFLCLLCWGMQWEHLSSGFWWEKRKCEHL